MNKKKGDNNSSPFANKHQDVDSLQKDYLLLESLFSATLDSLAGIHWWKDKDGVYRGCNDAMAEALQLESKNDIIGKTDYELPWTEQADELVDNDNIVMKTGKAQRAKEEPVATPDGELHIFLVSKSPLRDGEGNIIGTVGNSIDITAQKKLEQELIQSKEREEKAKIQQALIESAAQLSHDIRSPLAALNTVLRSLSNFPEDQRVLMRNAINRINDIANNLLTEYRDDTEKDGSDSTPPEQHKQEPVLLSSLLDSLLSEKKAQLGHRRIELNLEVSLDSYGVFVSIDAILFKRIISNLLNNAIEAIENQGKVWINLEKNGNCINIRIQDTGKGIPSDRLEQIRQGGISYEKAGGSGLGIASAISFAKFNGGCFDMQSELGSGTNVTLTLPISASPPWFQEQLLLKPGDTLVVLDDDESIHAIWTSRCQSLLQKISLKHLHHSQTFREFCDNHNLSDTLFLIDYELLGSDETGLDLIESLALQEMSILVTSRYEEPTVREKAAQLGIKIIPKNFSPYINISLNEMKQPQPVQLVFLDDSNDLTEAWEMAASLEQIPIKTFNTINDLKKELPSIPKDTPIYIDSNLNDDIKGEDFAKELYDQGYKELYLASGYPKEHFKDLPWIKEFVGKEPVFFK